MAGALKSRENRSSLFDLLTGSCDDGSDGRWSGLGDNKSVDVDKSVRLVRGSFTVVCNCFPRFAAAGAELCTAGAGECVTGSELAGRESKTLGSPGGGPSRAHLRLSYFERTNDSSL